MQVRSDHFWDPTTNFNAMTAEKQSWRPLLLIFLLMHMLQTTQAQNYKINKYGLKIIDNISQYQKIIAQHPERALVLLEGYIATLKTDFVYATKDNFTHQVLYHEPAAYLRQEAAEALKKVAEDLQPLGYGLIVYDSYRPYRVTEKMWEVVPDNRYAANPRHGSGHNRGLSIDISLYDLKTGQVLAMPTGFDDFTQKAHADYDKLPEHILHNRRLLKKAMQRRGFIPLSTEWWHFSYPGSKESYGLLDLSFEALRDLNIKQNSN